MNNNINDNKIYETASATSSKDRVKSSKSIYVFTVCVLALLCFGAKSCTSSLVSSISPFIDNIEEVPSEGLLEDRLDLNLLDGSEPESIEEFKNFIANKDSDDEDESVDYNAQDILNLNLDMYSHNISSYVAAISYSGASPSTRNFVYKLAKTDKEYSERIVSCVYATSFETEDKDEQIQLAQSYLDEAKEALENTTIPKDISNAQRKLFENSIWLTNQRYSYIEIILNAIKDPNSTSFDKVVKADKAVRYATKIAAKMLEEALILSTNK